MKPYYEQDGRKCQCGCGTPVHESRRYVSGHNFRGMKKSQSHISAIAAGVARAWKTKRKRRPIGTKAIDSCGYVRVKVVQGTGRWALEHVLVAEQTLGRRLGAGEVVHHINGDRADNRPENLFVCRDRSHHNAVHKSQDEALRTLLSR